MRDFDKDREVCAAATPGTWTMDEITKAKVYAGDDLVAMGCYAEDARFVVAAREGWPAALDRIAELEAQNAVLRQALGKTLDCLEQNVDDPDDVAIGIVREALATTPAQAAERVQGLVDALREVEKADTQQFIKNGVETVERTGKAGLVARDALAKWEGK